MKANQLEICQFSGHGHYKIGITHYNKLITCITSNMPDIDAYKRDCFNRKEEAEQRAAFRNLRNEIIQKNKNN